MPDGKLCVVEAHAFGVDCIIAEELDLFVGGFGEEGIRREIGVHCHEGQQRCGAYTQIK